MQRANQWAELDNNHVLHSLAAVMVILKVHLDQG